ncbi:hypothetical protein MMC17_000250 [Xylographa soralifera]|nr:hypothetical protein [Xylographa soralifera]
MATRSFSQKERIRFVEARAQLCTFENIHKSAEEFAQETFEDQGEQQKFLKWYLDTSSTEVDEMFHLHNLPADALWASIGKGMLTDESLYELFRNTAAQLVVDVFALGPTYRKGYAIDTRLPWGVGGALAIDYDTSNGLDFRKMEPVEPAELENRGFLVRFQDVGWIMMIEGSEWKKTGHVLVLDLHRNFSPWLVLAPEWFDHHKGGMVKPQRTLKKGEDTAPGILPGDKHWVPVAKLQGNFLGQISTWFHEKAVFTMEKSGIDKATRLPHIMEWYVDHNGDEVAYMRQDEEWYRYRNHRYIRATSKPAPR